MGNTLLSAAFCFPRFARFSMLAENKGEDRIEKSRKIVTTQRKVKKEMNHPAASGRHISKGFSLSYRRKRRGIKPNASQ